MSARQVIFFFLLSLVEVEKKRITHDESTSLIAAWVKQVNDWWQREMGVMYKVMPYWSRNSVGFLYLKKDMKTWKQAGKQLYSTQHCAARSRSP